MLDLHVRASERQSCHPQHVEAPGPADHLLCFREAAVVARDQHAAVQEMAGNLSGLDPVAIPAPGLGPDQNVVRFDKSIEVLGSFRLGLVSLRGWDQFVAGLVFVDVDEPIPKAGRELLFELACGPHYFARRY